MRTSGATKPENRASEQGDNRLAVNARERAGGAFAVPVGPAVQPTDERVVTAPAVRPDNVLVLSAASPTELVELVEQLADSVWPPRENIDRMIRSIRGEPEPWEAHAGRRPRRPWMRDTKRYDPSREPGDRYVVLHRREWRLTPTKAYERISPLPISVLVDVLVDALRAPGQPTDLELHRAPTPAMVNLIIEVRRTKARLTDAFENEAKRFNPDGTEQHRRRFCQKLIGIAERELGIDQAARKAAARRRRMPAPQARARQRQRDGIAAWARANVVKDAGSTLLKSDLTDRLIPWWRESCDDVPEPSAKMLAAVFGKPIQRGKDHVRVFVGLKLRP